MSPDFTALSSDAKSLRNCVRCERRRLALSDGSEDDVASALDAGYTGLVTCDEPTPEMVMTLPQLPKEVNEESAGWEERFLSGGESLGSGVRRLHAMSIGRPPSSLNVGEGTTSRPSRSL